jgi:SAM-dependent methyltransferase
MSCNAAFMDDASNGYEAIADEYLAHRGDTKAGSNGIGVATVRAWTRRVHPGGAVLDLGCGPGDPITRVLFDAGVTIYAVDASPRMVSEFRARFPGVAVECKSVEMSGFFGREFDAVIAWGLLFLLTPEAQALVIEKVARALVRGGRFLFTAPAQACEWPDAMTGKRSESLEAERYRRLLESVGLVMEDEADDEGANHYYMAFKP